MYTLCFKLEMILGRNPCCKTTCDLTLRRCSLVMDCGPDFLGQGQVESIDLDLNIHFMRRQSFISISYM